MEAIKKTTCRLLVFSNSIDARKFNHMIGAGFDATTGINVAFSNLPFAVNPPDSVDMPSDLSFIKDDYPTAFVAILRGLDWLIDPSQQSTVINISLGPGRYNSFHPDDPLQIATRLITGMGIVVVVAAGNVVDGPQPDSLQSLARAPWVISVGAISKNGVVLPSSARGAIGKPCPTVVSYGHPKFIFLNNEFDVPSDGTSFAAPRVAKAASFIYKGLEIIVGNIDDLLNDDWDSVTREIGFVTLGFADTSVHRSAIEPPGEPVASAMKQGVHSVRFSRSNAEKEWLLSMMAFTQDHGLQIETTARPAMVKKAIKLAAHLYGNHFLHQGEEHNNSRNHIDVGAGFIDERVARVYLESLTPSDLLSVILSEQSKKLPIDDMMVLDEQLGPLWNADKVSELAAYFLDAPCIKYATVVK